jgi:hypothetical protein
MAFALTFETLKAWCVRQQFQTSENAPLGQLAIHQNLLGQPAPLVIMPHFARGMVMFAMKQPYTVPRDRWTPIVEASALLDANLLMGAWVSNRETGELIFRVTIPALDIEYTDQGLVHVSRVVVGTSERAAPALRAIALEGADPQTVVGVLATAAAAPHV